MKNAQSVIGRLCLTVIAISGLVGSAPPVVNAAGDSNLDKEVPSVLGVCPPFHLLDEDGGVIDPVNNINADKPYSPKQTCGRCHDYEKITKGYHFTQGAGEQPTADQAARYLWVSSPGNYGGPWCSPAPLYEYLSPQHNESERMMDMTSFTFFSKGCGDCHPGGGPAEFDRSGRRYDRWMSDPSSGFTSGGVNNYDGDYFKARWNETGAIEADCLLCHMPGYNFRERTRQRKELNFRWAPTAAAGFAKVTGSIKNGVIVEVTYDKKLFDRDGTISPHIVREPRNNACLFCHEQPGWKKRGANFRNRTDVHLRAGMRCIDCHPAAQSAEDPRIHGREMHHIGKGDDPGGQVRNDLDNTMRDCTYCHSTGQLGAPIAPHAWLPPLHLKTIACQTCHIPQRVVKPIQFQASDVFSPGTKIPGNLKKLWTFYGPDRKYRNHYGYLQMMGYDDKPTEPFAPFLARYKGKIYPVNRVHTAWPAIEIAGETALMQPKMNDIYAMWDAHHRDPSKYQALSQIRDDNGDGVIEVNSPQEIESLISAVNEMLAKTGYPMEGKKVVWVMNDRVYSSGTEFRLIKKHEWEASPFGNVHKYSHDIYPAKAALGAQGCTDCHHPKAEFFFADALLYPFDENAQPVLTKQYHLLAISGLWATVGALRETYLKPLNYGLFAVVACGVLLLLIEGLLYVVFENRPFPFLSYITLIILCLVIGAVLFLHTYRPALMAYMLPSRALLDSNHFLFALLVFAAGVVTLYYWLKSNLSSAFTMRTFFSSVISSAMIIGFILAGVSGLLMIAGLSPMQFLTKASYTVFDVSLTIILIVSFIITVKKIVGFDR